MKLAEALLLRAEYKKKIESLQHRIMANLKVQENEKPHEDPNALMREIMELNETLCQLVKKINKRNNEVTLTNGQPISEALAERDMLVKKRQTLAAIAGSAALKDLRLTHTEVKIHVTVDIGKIQREIDSLSQHFRLLDTQIQEKNWSVDLE